MPDPVSPSAETQEVCELFAGVAARWPCAPPADLRWHYAVALVRRYPGLTRRPEVAADVAGLLAPELGGES